MSAALRNVLWKNDWSRDGQIVLCRILVTNDFVSSKQNAIMRCNEQQNGTKNVDEQRHMVTRRQVTRENVGDGHICRPQIIFTSTLWLIPQRDTEG